MAFAMLFRVTGMFSIHIFGVLFSLCAVALADEQAFSWVTGRKAVLNSRLITVFHYLTWAGLLTVVTTGSLLAFPQWQYLITQPLFVMKMLFVAILLVNAILIGRFSHVATTRSFSSLTWGEAVPLVLSGGISFIGWSGAFIVALIFFG